MAPKSRRSIRKKKQCWDLVVSTPEQSKGQKREAVEDLGKGKKKKGESSSNVNQERDPLYFLEDRDLKRYNLDFSIRKVINGRWIDYDFFDTHNFDFSSKMDTLGWMPLTLTRDDVYLDLVAYFYANAFRGLHSDSIKSYVKGTNISLDRSVIQTLLGIKLGEEVERQIIKRKNQLITVYGENVNLAAQPRANTLPLELRLVHHFIGIILILKTEKFEYVSDRELFFLWAYVTDSKIDVALFILDQMHKATIKKINLPYGMLLTKVFKYFRVDFNDEVIRVPKAVSDEYNEKTFKRMGYKLKGGQWILKSSKKVRGESSSKGNEPIESEVPETESFKTEMRAFMTQLSDSIKMLHTKINNMAFCLVIVGKKIRNLTREVQKGKIPMEDDESEEEQEKENEDAERNKRDGDNEEEVGQKEKEDNNHENRDDCSETESDASPILIRRKSQRLGRLSKFSNTATTALELSPSPSSSPSTPIHAPHASTSHITSPPPPL
ncbi:hypothetical protein Acr_00g0074460 [Actinidia rufa]|uniref:Putative plant transposon protein domain-containing protein n=1 Tax=Actinidia rufa TaxID=165716 RepID=A0A7J0DSS0_9ERIC|nr:hypothetical protein Acr_00g0074460 [Actinidia rufa]